MDFPSQLDPYRDALLKIARPSAAFEPYPAPSGYDIKSSKMGGVPFTPRYTDWPSSNVPGDHLVTKKRPQAFVGQFNFSEIVAAVPELKDVVPDRGLLQLFYDLHEGTWGLEYPRDLEFFRVLWYPDVEGMEHVPMELASPSFPLKEFGLKFSYRPSFPDPAYLPEEIELTEEAETAYYASLVYDSHHQIAGYPIPVQNEPMEDIELASKDGNGPWQVLLQIDSDQAMQIMWGDTGTIYLGVKDSEMTKADLGRARLVLQCL